MFPEDGPTGAGVRVAVIDTGLDLDHPDFDGALDGASQSFVPTDDLLVDRCWHGTVVAGIIAGRGAMSEGRYRGMAPAAKLIVLKSSVSGRGLEDVAVRAVLAAIDSGADIINYSNSYSPKIGPAPWVWPSRRSIIEDAFRLASERGILCVVAAGNDGPNEGSIGRPGGLDCLMTVGATEQGKVWSASSRGPYRTLDTLRVNEIVRWDLTMHGVCHQIRKPDVVAPGVGTVAPLARHCQMDDEALYIEPGNFGLRYMRVQGGGTSFAAPVVSGMAAALLQIARERKVNLGPNPGRTLKMLLSFGAARLVEGSTDDFGHGLVHWPRTIAALKDFHSDPHFREIVLNGSSLRLL